MSSTKRLLLYLVLFLVASCLEDYQAALRTEDTSLLVVDGYVSTGTKTVSVKLTLAKMINDESAYQTVNGATVEVESKDGAVVRLVDQGNGIYSVTDPSIINSGTYRLHIQSPTDEYFSSYVTSPQSNSVIDQFGYRIEGENIKIYLDAYDNNADTKYFLWDFTETWEYQSSFPSYFKKVGDKIVRREDDEHIGICWKDLRNSEVLLYNAERQSQPLVKDFLIQTIHGSSQKLTRRYSILVRQRALNEEAYKYWQELKNTTESVGGLFDSQLTRVTGNITSSSGKPVLGYFSSSDITEKRIFITNDELPIEIQDLHSKPLCNYTTDLTVIPGDRLNTITDNLALIEFDSQSGGYYTADLICVDCRVQGGVTRRPSFW